MKTSLFIILFLFSLKLCAQPNDRFLFGGALGYRYSSDKGGEEAGNGVENEEHLFQVNAAAGYFVSRNIALGLSVENLYDKVVYDDYTFDEIFENALFFSAFARYYTAYGIFLHGQAGLGYSDIEMDGKPIPGSTGYHSISISKDYNISGFIAGIGYRIPLNEALSLEPNLNYMRLKYTTRKEVTGDFVRNGMMFSVGLVYYLK